MPIRRRLMIEELESRVLMTSGLVAAYNFAQGSGTVLTDISGNGNNGTINNAAWTTVNSSSNLPFTGALSFNGTNALVNIPNAASLQLTKGMTLEAWINPTAAPNGWQDIVYKGNDNYFLESSSQPSNTPVAGVTVGSNDTGAFGTSPLPTNTWSFLTETFNGSTLILYVNGVQVASQALSGSLTTSTNPLQIGGDSIYGQYFQGLISNVRIYNTALSQTAIQADMTTPISSIDTPPTVTSVTPANNASNVSTGTAVTVQFSEALDPTTVTSSTIQLLNSSGSAVAASVSYNSSTDTATLTPSSALANSSTYTVLVHGGTSGAVVKDAADTPLAANFSSSFTTAAASTTQPFPNNQPAPPLPAPTGTVINVSTVSQLESAVANLQSGQTIMIAKGTYNLTGTLYVPQGLTNIAIRGATGNAGDVVIQGDAVLDPTSPYNGSDIWGTGSGISGSIPFGIWLGNVQGVTIADMTLKNFVDDAIILNAGVQSPLIHNVVMLDTGEQLLKSNPNGSGGGVNNGIVEYCTIGYTSLAPNSYTNGIDLHTTQNWIIRNNLFQNIATTNPLLGTVAGPAVLVWNGSKNCTVENNTFINCQREIAFGLSDPSTITDDNTGGIIANNFIYRSGTQHGDVSIGVWNSPGTEVSYNTVILNGDYVNAIEYRFSTTTGVNILYNLTDAAITQRDGASATVTGNVTSGVQSSWFVNESVGNLHLTSSATGAIGKGKYLSEVSTDYDGQARPSTGPTDVGADEYQAATDTPPTVTSVTPANNASNVSTGTAVTVQFSEALDSTTVTTSTIQLLNSSGSAVAASVSYNSSTDTATLTPSAALANSSTYTVLVHGGTSGAVIKDAAGTPLAANFSSSFTTIVAPPPTPTGVTATPGNGQATLSWSASSGATSYNIYRSTTSGGEGSTPYKTGVTATSFTDTGLTNGTTYYYQVSAVNAGGQSPLSTEVSAKPQAAGSLVQAIDAGGAASGSFVADSFFNGGSTYANSNTINTSNVSNPAPQSVYDSERYGNFTYTIGNLTPGAAYTVRLDFAEIYWNQAGQRVFNVAINGSQVLSNFDIYAAAGGKNIAIARSFSTAANANGQIAIQFTTVVDNAKVSGIEIFSGSTAAPATPSGLTATVGIAQATLNWSAVPGATSYNIYRSTTSGGEGSTPYKTGVTATSFTDTGLTNGTTYYYQVSAVNAGGQSPVSTEVSARPGFLAIDSGGKASGSYIADAYFSGGNTYANSDTINTSNVSNPAPQSVYDSERNGNFTYTAGNLTPGASYTVRLDFAEIFFNQAGARVFNVAINGSQVLSNFDIYAAAGGKDIAIARSFSTVADANGQITIQFTSLVNHAKVSGIEILPVGTAPTVTGVTPANGATNTSPSGSVQVTFSEALDPTTVNSNTVQLLDPSNSVVAATVSYNSSTNTATLTPSNTLASNTTYTVLVHGGNTGAVVKDTLGNALAANFTSSFTTDAPLAASAGPTESGKEGTAVQFAGSSSGGTGGSSYLWNFGDGSTATGTLTPSHTYLTAGTYTVTLTVTDNANDTVKSTTTATVADVPPTANPGGPYSGVTGTAINFNGSGSDPDPKDTLSYAWNFGDGTTSTQQAPSHTYTAAGTYTVTFTVTASDGAKTTATTTVTVSNPSNLVVTSPYITTPYDTIPNFGAKPTIYTVKSGNWSDPTIWSLDRLPQAGDIVDINPGTTVTYDLSSTVPLNTLEIQPTATLTFRTDINTQVVVGNFLVLQGGNLVIGTQANPVAANVMAQVFFANQAINTATDPNQFGTGLIVMGNITTYGAAKTPYVTLAQEAHAGDTVLHLATPATGWRAGDVLELPDTRQLTNAIANDAFNTNIAPQWEQLTVQSVSVDGLTVTLTAPLQYDHLGARDANGVLRYLPQVTDVSRNVMFASAVVPTGVSDTRGYTLFTYRANVNVQNTGFCELGRSTGSNQGDRTPMTMHNLIGPTSPQANGYQFTLVGNVVNADCVVCTNGTADPSVPSPYQWGIVLNNSFYGLIQSNVVVNAFGAGIGVEDGASSYNRFDSNFVMLVNGTGGRLDDQLQGDGYWFHNPNNYVTNNIATDINGYHNAAYSYGFDVNAVTNDIAAVGTVLIPTYQGADPSQSGQSKSINMNATPILEFSGNEAYGAMPRGFSTWWLGTQFETPDGSAGTLQNSVVWNQYDAGYYTYETNNLVIDGFTALGDASQLSNPYNYTTGLHFADYMTRNAVVENLNIQDEGTGITVPTNVGRGGASDVASFTIQNAYLRNIDNIDIPLLCSSNGGSGLSSRKVIIQNVQFVQPSAALPSGWQSENIVMDATEGADPSFYNTTSTTEVDVLNYNNIAGDNFQVFYAYNKPANATTMALIQGYVVAS